MEKAQETKVDAKEAIESQSTGRKDKNRNAHPRKK